MIKAILYVSTMNKEHTEENIKLMTIKFRKFNKANNITGILLYSRRNIIQYIEGYCEVLDNLYSRILKDLRHYNIITLYNDSIYNRLFIEWNLRFDIIYFKILIDFKKDLEKQKNIKILSLFNDFILINNI